MSILANLWGNSDCLASKQHNHLAKCLVDLCPALAKSLGDSTVISICRAHDKCPAECQGSSNIPNAPIADAVTVLCRGLPGCNLAVPGLWSQDCSVCCRWPLCMKDEGDRSLNRKVGSRRRVISDRGRALSNEGGVWQHLSIVRGFRVISSGVSFLHWGARFPCFWGMKRRGAGAPGSKGTWKCSQIANGFSKTPRCIQTL